MSKEEGKQYIERMYARNPELKRHSQLVELTHGPNPDSSTLLHQVIKDQAATERILTAVEMGKDAEFVTWLSLGLFSGGVAIEIIPVLAYVLGPLGAFQSGTSATQAVTGEHWLTGKKLGRRERVESGISGGLGLTSLFGAAVTRSGTPSPPRGTGTKPPVLPAEPVTQTRGGTLTPAEMAELQAIADTYQTEIHVVGSRAAGQGRNIETNLPVGKGPGTRSDIDVRISGEADIASGGRLSHDISNVSGGAGNTVSSGLPQIPSEPPVIKITPVTPGGGG